MPKKIRLEGISQLVRGRVWDTSRLARIGRLPNLEVCIPHTDLSRLHAEIDLTETGWVIRDLGSTNGTFLNGERLGRNEAKLRVRDIVQLSRVTLVVSDIHDDGVGATPAESRPEVKHLILSTRETFAPALRQELQSDAAGLDILFNLGHIGRGFDASGSVEGYLKSILWRVAETVDAREGAIFVPDGKIGRSRTSFSLIEGKEPDLVAYRQLADDAVTRRESILIQRPASDTDKEPCALICALFRHENKPAGVLCLSRGQGQSPFDPRDLQIADALTLFASPSVASVVHCHERQETLFLKTLTLLMQLLQMRDEPTGNHAQRVTDYALLLAEQLRVPDMEKYYLRVGAPLHDLGKIGIKDSVLRKPGELIEIERIHVREQILKAASLLEQVPQLSPLLPIVRNSHERWDGRGYPDGLAGRNIPLLARIVAVADAFDAITTDQPYRKALPLAKAFEEINKGSGSQFDPDCVNALLHMREMLEKIIRQRRDETETVGLEQLKQMRATIDIPAQPRDVALR